MHEDVLSQLMLMFRLDVCYTHLLFVASSYITVFDTLIINFLVRDTDLSVNA